MPSSDRLRPRLNREILGRVLGTGASLQPELSASVVEFRTKGVEKWVK